MALAQTNIIEIDQSQVVSSFPGVYGAMVIPNAERGPLEPVLVTNESQFLDIYTVNNKIIPGMHVANYDALLYLAHSNQLWVHRVLHSDATYSSIIFNKTGASTVTDTVPTTPLAAPSVTATGTSGGSLTPASTYYYQVTSTNQFGESTPTTEISVSPGTGNGSVSLTWSAVTGATGYKVYRGSTSGSEMYLTSLTSPNYVDTGAVTPGTYVPPTANSTTWLTDPENYQFGANELFMVHARDQGNWGNRLSVATAAPAVSEFAGHFQIIVYLDQVLMETFKVSRQKVTDGFGTSRYIEDVLKASNYIRAVDNVGMTDTVMPGYSPSTGGGNTGQTITYTPTAMVEGQDGSAVTEGDIIKAYDKFYNKDVYACTILLDAGNATAAIQKELLAIAQDRHDCVAILSVPFDVMQDSVTYSTDIISYKNSVLDANSSYGGLYAPFVQIYDKFNDRKIFIDPSAFVAEAINNSYTQAELWYPAAGYNRGVLLEALDCQIRFTEGEMSTLYDNSINPIRFTVGRGIVVWGQKTLSFPPSARDRMNVRLLLAVIEPAMKTFLDGFLFELNLPDTRLRIIAGLKSYLTDIQHRDGIEGFKIVCDNTNNSAQDVNNYRLNVDIYIIPAKSIETINERILIEPTGVSFIQV